MSHVAPYKASSKMLQATHILAKLHCVMTAAATPFHIMCMVVFSRDQ